MKKMKFRIIAMLLVMAMAVSLSSECFAQGGTTYISEIKSFQSRAECENAGYIFSGADLNEGGSACYIGYKTTTDKNKAITNLKMLQMGIGYQTDYNYGELMEEKLNLEPTATNLHTAAVYFTKNYEGSPLGQAAVKVLNYYYVPAEYTEAKKDTPFGDFILSDEFTTEFIEGYLVRTNGSKTNLLIGQLAAGVADKDMKDTWATRIGKTTTVSVLAKKKPTSTTLKKYDKQHKYYAGLLFKTVQDFAQEASDAIEYKNTYGSFDNIGAAVAAEQGEEAKEEYVDKALAEGTNKEDNYPMYYDLYCKLNDYQVNTDLKLGDYILSFKDLDAEKLSDLRRLYPLVEAMKREQVIMTKYAGLATMTGFLNNTVEVGEICMKQVEEKMDELFDFILTEQLSSDNNYYNKTDAEKKAIRDELKKKQKISIYDGIQSDFYKEEICVTNDIIMTNIASGDLSEFIDNSDKLARERSKKELTANLILSSVSMLDLGIHLVIDILSLCGVAVESFAAVYSCFSLPLLVISILSIFLIKLFNSAAAWKDWQVVETGELEADKVEWTDIPGSIYSIEKIDVVEAGVQLQKTRINEYRCMRNGTGDAYENLNRGSGSRWNALYYSTEAEAGSPLVVGSEGKPFKVQANGVEAPAKYTALTIMGSSSTANINAYAEYTDKSSMNLFYCTEDSQNSSDEGSNQGTQVRTNTYLSGIILAYSNNETTAKAKITNKGYTLIDHNLTPDHLYYLDKNHTKLYTYIGIKTTRDVKAAITDIRVVNSSADQQIAYGGATYVNAGTTVGGDSLVYTMGETAGTPITGEIFIYDSPSSAPDGYEPVNLLGGGPAFNFSRSSTKNYFLASYTIEGRTSKYLYFKPTTMYTDGTKYVSGIFALRCCWESGDFGGSKLEYFKTYLETKDITALTEELPGDYTSYSGSGGEQSDYVYSTIRQENRETYGALAYSTTYNPYRAIYDIKVYQGSNTAESLFAAIGTAKGGYAACESYGLGRVYYSTGMAQTIDEWGNGGESYQNKIRITILPFHSISKTVGSNLNTDPDDYEGAVYADLVRTEFCEVQPESDYVSNCLKGLYVLGNTNTDIANARPIRPEQLYLSTKANDETYGWCRPVVSFMNPNSATPMSINNMVTHNMTGGLKLNRRKMYEESMDDCSSLNEKGPYYLYIKLMSIAEIKEYTAGTQKKYISSIAVGGSNVTDTGNAMISYNDDIARVGALAGSSDGILYDNLALKEGEAWYESTQTKDTQFYYYIDNTYINFQYKSTYTPKQNTDRASYIGVSRTADSSEAIYNIIKVKISNTAKVPTNIWIDNVTYQSAGGLIYDRNGAYALYYTTNIGAGDGTPITDISIGDTPMVNGKLGICCYTLGGDGKTTEYGDTTAESGKYILMTSEGSAGESDQQMAYISLGIGAGATKAEAMGELLSKGYQTFIDADLNYKARTGHVYMGYIRVPYTQLVEEGEEDLAITDVIFRVGKTYRPLIGINGTHGTITYEGDPTSLNAYTNGEAVYMYVTRDPAAVTATPRKDPSERVVEMRESVIERNYETTETKNTGKYAISDIRFYVGIYRPDVTVKQWEVALDEYGNMANLNQGVWQSKKGDARLYMYVSRVGNRTKEECEQYLSETYSELKNYYIMAAEYAD